MSQIDISTVAQEAYSSIIHKLERAHANYEILSHAPVYTMEDVSKQIDIPEFCKVKTIVLQAEINGIKDIIICGVSASGKLDISAVCRHLSISRSKISMINPNQSEELLGVPKGAIGLITPKGDHAVLLSSFFANQDQLYFGVGLNDKTLRISLPVLSSIINIKILDIERK